MNKQIVSAKSFNYSLGVLLLVVALNAFGGGYYAMAGAVGVPVEWLKAARFIIIIFRDCFFLLLWAASRFFPEYLF